MKTAMTVNWHCRKCGTSAKLIYDVPVTRQKAYVDVMKAHSLPIQDIERPGNLEHMQAVQFNVRHARAANSQQSLFTKEAP